MAAAGRRRPACSWMRVLGVGAFVWCEALSYDLVRGRQLQPTTFLATRTPQRRQRQHHHLVRCSASSDSDHTPTPPHSSSRHRWISRPQVLSGLSGLLAVAFGATLTSGADTVRGEGLFPAAQTLLERVTSDDIVSPGIAGMGSPAIPSLPRFLFGTWTASMQFVNSSIPLGPEYVPPQILRSINAIDTKVISFPLRFFSTSPEAVITNDNRAQVIPDRAYNTKACIEAYYGFPAVQEVVYDPGKNPRRLRVTFSTVGADLQPLPPRRQELFINNIRFESPSHNQYVLSEYIRTVNLGMGVSVSDSETISYYEYQTDGTVLGKQRVAIYLTPNPNNKEGEMYFETQGKAVALFDYNFEMKRQGTACVTTPEGLDQCLG